MSYGNHHGPGPLPNRWLYCPRNSDSFIADKFLAFKTPLSSKFASQMPVECQFEPDMVFSFMKVCGTKLGLWIDLTNTNRFYDRKEIETRGVEYKKLQCRGHGETPSMDQTKSFIEIVDAFVQDHPLDMVGVHCTHGFNRTGFLIVSYMVERMDCSVEAALMSFSELRPPGIYKADYISELFRRYEPDEDPLPAPELPDWCDETPPYQESFTSNDSRKRQHDDSLDDTQEDASAVNDDEDAVLSDEDANNSASTSSSPNKKRRRKEMVNFNAKFMDGVPGVTLVKNQSRLQNLQRTVQDMCKWEKSGFPGSQPVSMDVKNILFLQQKPYKVSWKADGTRYMMLILKEGEVYFFDRDNSCFQVERLRFVHRKNLHQHLTNTLLDGEMVIDKVQGVDIPRYLVYDVIKFENKDLLECTFSLRLHCMKFDIVEPRYAAMMNGIIDKSREPFSVRIKDFWDITQTKALLSPKFTNGLSHEPDGLIFQPSETPYTPGPCPDVLKWKPIEMNSVDFRLRIVKESGEGILSRKIGLLFVGRDTQYSTIKYKKFLNDYNNKIIECKFENNAWVFMRERTDKSYPNSKNTADAVCASIKNPVTKEMLLDFIENYRFHKDNDIMPPPAAPGRNRR